MSSLIQYQLSKDANRVTTEDVIYPSKYVNAYVLAAGQPQTVIVPAGARIAMFSFTDNFYANFQGGVAAVPSANIINGSSSELNPINRDVSKCTSFSVIAPGTCILTISYFT